jgi:MFS family permease
MLALLSACAVGFAFSANFTNHAPLVPTLMGQFQFTQAMAGLLATGLFLTHALMQIPGGHLTDRFGAKPVLGIALAIVCLGNVAIAFSTAWWQLLLWKAFTGVGTGTCFVGTARYLAARLSGARLHVAQGYYGGCILLGSGFVIFAIPQVLAAWGWRWAFGATSAISLAAFLLWTLAAPGAKSPVHPPVRLASMLADPQLWLLGIVQAASFGLVIVVGSWITMLLRESLGLAPKVAGMVGSLVLMVGVVTRPSGGAAVSRLGVRRVLASSLLMTGTGCVLLGAAHSLGVALAGILLVGAGCGLPFPALVNRAAALYPGRAGAAIGLTNTLGVTMILAGAPLVGQVADWTGSFRSSFAALGIFALAACASSFAIHEK